MDDEGVNPGESQNQALLYAYPDNHQTGIATAAPIVLRFSSAVNLGEAQNAITVYEGDAQTGTVVAVTPEPVAGEPNNVLLEPDQDLKPNQTYTVVIEGLRLSKGTAKDQTLTFTTRPLHEGPKSLVVKDDTFKVSRRMPDGSEMEPVMDFSSFRFQFTQPIDRATAAYGDGNTVVLRDSGGAEVEAGLLVDGAYMTVDPTVDYLTPGETYTLELTGGLASTYGEAFAGETIEFTPKDSSPRGAPAFLVQKVTDSRNRTRLSRLSGRPVNEVPVNGVLLGEDKNISQSHAEAVTAELADVTRYPEVTPLRIPRNTVFQGSPIEPILIGGEVPAGFGSGEVAMRVLSDATGYLVDNPYSNHPDALRLLKLFMDVAIVTEEDRANGGFTQNLLHIELVGVAETDTREGVLNIDAIGVVEPNILGQEHGYGLLSFQLQSYKDQVNAPVAREDVTSPWVRVWAPGEETDLHRPGDPLSITFNEPLAEDTLRAGETVILVDGNGSPVPFGHRLDGASLVINPTTALAYGGRYELAVTDAITDLAGNPLLPETHAFRLPEYESERAQAPVVLTTYPGFPCVTVDPDLAAGDVGRCKGGKEDDQHLPLSLMPRNRPIHVSFSQALDPASVNENTFLVEKVDAGDPSSGDAVPGRRSVSGRTLRFEPEQPWQEGALYRYTLKSAIDHAECGVGAICDGRGLPLQTRLLAPSADEAPEPGQGGEDLSIFFRGSAPTNAVLQHLRNLPTADTNANFNVDAGEPVPSENPRAELNMARLVRNPDANPAADGTAALAVQNDSARTVVDVNVGCGFDPDNRPLSCPDQTALHLTGNLDVDVVGFLEAGEIARRYPGDESIPEPVRNQGGILVYIYPTRIILSGTTVHTRQTDFVESIGVTVPPTPTGPQLMRIRYTCDVVADCGAPDHGRVRGWIINQAGAPRMLTDLDLYLDAPKLNPQPEQDGEPSSVITVESHDLHSKPLHLTLEGGVSFLDDGRLRIEQISTEALPIDVTLDISIVAQDDKLFLQVPAGGTRLNYISEPIKP